MGILFRSLLFLELLLLTFVLRFVGGFLLIATLFVICLLVHLYCVPHFALLLVVILLCFLSFSLNFGKRKQAFIFSNVRVLQILLVEGLQLSVQLKETKSELDIRYEDGYRDKYNTQSLIATGAETTAERAAETVLETEITCR